MAHTGLQECLQVASQTLVFLVVLDVRGFLMADIGFIFSRENMWGIEFNPLLPCVVICITAKRDF